MTQLFRDVECLNLLRFRYSSSKQRIMAAHNMLFILLVSLWTVYMLEYVTCYHVKCRFNKDSISGTLEGLEGYEEFNDFLNRCGDRNIKILTYKNCYVGYVSLPIERIQMNYPSLKRIYWSCKGLCVYMRSSVYVEGCTGGKFWIYFFFVLLQIVCSLMFIFTRIIQEMIILPVTMELH